ncbi:hypothetical protein C5167_034497 [Papaver somniferum]|uniref:Uncharacterized protein n=1 Tax=Papaver somniferum TaxID=3469 RepID=A0A4Y7KG21_PAPSO|nr:hypothetical protein C5167_034497 [Papaver somniferum]
MLMSRMEVLGGVYLTSTFSEAKSTFSSSVHGGASASTIGGSARNKFLPQKQQQHHHQQQHISTVSQLLAGGIVGAISKTCTAPLARLTILFQVQGMHTDVANLNKANMEGGSLQSIPGLERRRENVTSDLFVRLVGGGLAAITTASITYPLDLVRTRLAAHELHV